MENLEDGELPSSPDELHQNLDMEHTGVTTHPVYTPLPRPQVAAASNRATENKAGLVFDETPISSGNLNRASVPGDRTDQRLSSKTYSYSSSDTYSSDEDSDSDNQTIRNCPSIRKLGRKSRKRGMQHLTKEAEHVTGDGGESFKMAAAAYQKSLRDNNGALPTSGLSGEERRKGSSTNNVWGSILREDALTSELTSIAVGRKSVKDLNSDRGAEVLIN